jgi:hypothetical protein
MLQIQYRRHNQRKNSIRIGIGQAVEEGVIFGKKYIL